MCKVGKRVPAEISVKVSEVKHRGRIAESAGKAERGLRRGGQGRSGRFSREVRKGEPLEVLIARTRRMGGKYLLDKGKILRKLCVHTGS